MLDPQVLTVFGMDRDVLLFWATIAGGIAVLATVVAMTVVSVLPAYSKKWGESLGGDPSVDTAPAPEDEIPGFDEPVDPERDAEETNELVADEAAPEESAEEQAGEEAATS